MRQCRHCGLPPAPSRCSRCKSAFYCNSDCQAKDWRGHKAACKPEAVWELREGSKKQENPGKESMVLREVETSKKTAKKSPTSEMFPPPLQDFLYESSPDGADENLLILLHGTGDTHSSFGALARKMRLPQTATLALSGPIKFPEEIIEGRAWFTCFDEHWELLQPALGLRTRIDSLEKTKDLLELMLGALCKNCGWQRNRIHLFGFSSGGTVALNIALHSCGSMRLGGVVAISASLLPEVFLQENATKFPACEKECTPVLITHGVQDEVVSRADVERTKMVLEKLHPTVPPKLCMVNKGHTMINTAEEMQFVMGFWEESLHRRMLHMEAESTLYEVTSWK